MASSGTASVEAEQVELQVKEDQREPVEQSRGWPVIVAACLGALLCLYVFLLGLELLGTAFKCLGGRGAGAMFSAVDEPIAGLMTGILGTVLVQSSSTSTSIVVGLVGAGQITVRSAIPVVMGANIGTSVTNTIVSMGQSGDRIQLQRAFAGATVHDMFNLLSVCTLLPVELIVGAIQGQGGPLFWLTKVIADAAIGGEKGDDPLKGASPIKAITKPVTELVISNNKYIIKALSLGAPEAQSPTEANSTACEPLASASNGTRRLLSRRLRSELKDCSQYYCVAHELDKNFKKISKTAYSKDLTQCEGYIHAPAEPCGAEESCFLDAGSYYKTYVEEKHIIKGGFTAGAGDVGGGMISLIFALVLLIGGLFGLCQLLHLLFMGKAKGAIVKATKLNDYAALLVGVIVTIVVQSSSVVTSALTPFCGLGLLPLEKMLPMTLGANIGTTVTALIASLSVFTHDAIHIALCHLFFNVFGILIWFPAPFMRRVPLGAAGLLGLYASCYRAVPAYYILTAFVAVPALSLGVSSLFEASVAAGVAVLLALLCAVGAFEFWWIRLGGCYRVLSLEAREDGKKALERADREVRGESAEGAEGAEGA